jgi:hypothetical protein
MRPIVPVPVPLCRTARGSIADGTGPVFDACGSGEG